MEFLPRLIKLEDNNRKLSHVEKLYYLKTNLKEEALKLVQYYAATWKILNQRYGKLRILFGNETEESFEEIEAEKSSEESQEVKEN